MKRKSLVLLGLVVVCVGVAGVFVVKKFFSQEAVVDREKASLPTPAASNQPSAVSREIESATARNTQNAIRDTSDIPDELNLNVPFTVQAPSANWDRTHEEACEEAAMLMANRYFEKRGIDGAEDAEAGIQQIIDWENKNLGFFESTTAQETARVLKEMLNLQTQILDNPSIEDIKGAIAENKLVLVPTAGRQIGNPFYKSPGPLYHMLLIKGYTKSQFITNDAGTKRGENYPYDFKTVLSANHDWNGGDVANGAKKIIIVTK